jgi:hypothetical protein
MGHASTQMLLTRYAKFVKSEEIKIESSYNLFGYIEENVCRKSPKNRG